MIQFLHIAKKLMQGVSARKPQAGQDAGPGDLVKRASKLHREGLGKMIEARKLLNRIYPYARPEDDYVQQIGVLNDKIEEVLKEYREDENSYKYFYGFPYQALGMAGAFGDRVCDFRFDAYELKKFINSTHKVLDIGCNCGYMGILASYRTGCKSYGIDINPYMIRIGNIVADFLKVADLVSLSETDVKSYKADETFDVVLSFATHWTDDGNYRVSIGEHMGRMHDLLRDNGILIFETHCNDLESPEFYAAMECEKERYSFDGFHKKTDSGTRELYVMKKIPAQC